MKPDHPGGLSPLARRVGLIFSLPAWTRISLPCLTVLCALSGCSSAPVPLSDQGALDLARISVPDTFPSAAPVHPRVVRILRSEGFRWNDPRFTLGHHLIRGNEVAWFDRHGRLHITRYTGEFSVAGYRIRRYVPSPSGDLEHRGTHIRSSLPLCLFNRPAEAVRHHKKLNSMALLTEVVLGGPVDLLIIPVTAPVCLLSDRLPDKFDRTQKSDDLKAASKILEKSRQSPNGQNGKPMPRYVTAPASDE